MSQKLEQSIQDFTTEYLKASQNYFDKPNSQGLSRDSAAKLNKLSKKFNKELDEIVSSLIFTEDTKVKLTEEQKREEINKFKVSSGIDVLDRINFQTGDSKNKELDEFIQKINELNLKKISGELKSPAESEDFKKLENIQRSKDLADYIKETCSVDSNYIENLQKDKILKDYLTKINFNPEVFNKEKEQIEKEIKLAEKQKDDEKVRKLNQEKQRIIDEYFQKLALESLQKNPLLFKSLEENTAFKTFIDRKNKEFENNNKDLFKGIDPKERKDVINATRTYSEAGGLKLKDALFLAKIAYKVAFPHTILTGLAVKGLQKMGVFEKANDYLKSSINDLKGKTMFQKAIPMLKISAMALLAGGAVSVLVAAHPELLDQTFDGAKSIMSNVSDSFSTNQIEATNKVNYLEQANQVPESAQSKPEIKLTDTIKTEKYIPQDNFNQGVAPIDSSLSGSSDYQEKNAFNDELKSAQEKGVNDYIQRIEKEFTYDLSIASKDPTEILNTATLAAQQAALDASNLPPVSAQEAAKAAFEEYEKAMLAAEQAAKGLVTIEPTTAFEKSLIGRELPVGNIWKTGAMDLVKELNPHIADPDKIYPGQEIKLPLFGKDELGNRIITGFEVKTVSAGDTMSEMYVNSAREQLNNLKTVELNKNIEPSVIKPTVQIGEIPVPYDHKVELASKTTVDGVSNHNLYVNHQEGYVVRTTEGVPEEQSANIYHADDKGVVSINESNEIKSIRESMRLDFNETARQPVQMKIIGEDGSERVVNSELGKSGFITKGVTKDGFHITSINSPEILDKVKQGIPITEEELKKVQDQAREFKKENPMPDRVGSRFKPR